MLNSSNAKAYAVLSILFDLYGDNCSKLRVLGYENGREHGFNVYCHPNMDRTVAFSESRNSDSIMVYSGESYQFNPQGNGPSEEMYRKVVSFGGTSYLPAAQWIKEFFDNEDTE